jgi:hypothetical protein
MGVINLLFAHLVAWLVILLLGWLVRWFVG